MVSNVMKGITYRGLSGSKNLKVKHGQKTDSPPKSPRGLVLKGMWKA